SRMPRDPMTLFNLKRLSPKEEFPNLARNYTCMGRILTLDMYKRQFNRATESGVIFDDVIRPGLEDPGKPSRPEAVGCVAGDAQSYVLFCDFFDRIIEAYHGYKVTSSRQESDFNYNILKGGDDFDPAYVAGCKVCVSRSLDDFSFPTHCSRGERRQLLALAKTGEQFPGQLYSMEEVSQRKQDNGFLLKVPSEFQMRTGMARDWPDSRAVWVSTHDNLVVWINIEDHLQFVSKQDDSNIKKAFETVCTQLQRVEAVYRTLRHSFIWKEHLGWVVSSPAEVGTGLKASIRVKLPNMAQHRLLENILERLRVRMDTRESSGVCTVTNAQTIGFTEVELMQLLMDGVKMLITMEKKLEASASIDHLIPAQK
ncbi:hypothetical protein Z043_109894, partial [Scleropages formosus]